MIKKSNLQGMRDEAVAKFQGFMLVAEPAIGNTAIQSPTSLGTFQLVSGDAMTKFSHKCSHSIEATSSMNKEHITVKYTGARTIKLINTDANLRQCNEYHFLSTRRALLCFLFSSSRSVICEISPLVALRALPLSSFEFP